MIQLPAWVSKIPSKSNCNETSACCTSVQFRVSSFSLRCPHSVTILTQPSSHTCFGIPVATKHCVPYCTVAFTSLFFSLDILLLSIYVHWHIRSVVPCALFYACCSTYPYLCRFLYCCDDDLLLLHLPYCILTTSFRMRYTSATASPRELYCVREKWMNKIKGLSGAEGRMPDVLARCASWSRKMLSFIRLFVVVKSCDRRYNAARCSLSQFSEHCATSMYNVVLTLKWNPKLPRCVCLFGCSNQKKKNKRERKE